MTEITNRLRGEIPFEEGGEGVVLRYYNSDLIALQKQFGDEWFMNAGDRLNKWDMEFMQACIVRGAKKNDAFVNVKFDAIDVPMSFVSEKILDALYMSTFGERFGEHIKRITDTFESLAAQETPPVPPPSPENSSST